MHLNAFLSIIRCDTMVSWKKRYERLKSKSKEVSLLGKITGGLNSLGRRLPTLACNITSGIAAAIPLAKHLPALLNHAANQQWDAVATRASWVVRDTTGYDQESGSFDWHTPVKYAAGVMGPQLVKKGVQKVGGMF